MGCKPLDKLLLFEVWASVRLFRPVVFFNFDLFDIICYSPVSFVFPFYLLSFFYICFFFFSVDSTSVWFRLALWDWSFLLKYGNLLFLYPYVSTFPVVNSLMTTLSAFVLVPNTDLFCFLLYDWIDWRQFSFPFFIGFKFVFIFRISYIPLACSRRMFWYVEATILVSS